MINHIKIIMFVSIFVVTPLFVHAAVSDFLILQDIGSYKFITQTKNPLTKKIVQIPGYTTRNAPGILAGADHFDLDHDDATYETDYESDVADLGVEVQVTKHTDPNDTLRWLLHEVERGFRDTDNLEAGPAEDAMIREINSNKIYFYGGGIIGYRWISNNIVVNIQYSNLSGPKPEPIEVVKAYLAKLPSSIVLSDSEFKARAHNETWIKDEMDRRLWLCDKWFLQITLKKAEEKQVYQECVKSMNVFLDYREKYFGRKAADEKNLLADYLNANNGTGIKTKLTEYKNWWTVHKTGAISL